MGKISLTGSQAEAGSLAALTETTVVLASVRSMRGLDRRTGEQRWTSEPDRAGGLGGGGAAVDGELVVRMSPMGIMAFDARSGETRWRIAGTGSSPLQPVTVAAGLVLGAVGDGPSREIRAVDAVTGKDRWTKPGEPSYGGLWAIGDGIVLATLPAAGALVAYDLNTGDVRWKRETSAQFYAHPELIDGSTVVAPWEDQLATLATADGSTVWVLDQPFGSSLMNATGVTPDLIVVAVNSKVWRD